MGGWEITCMRRIDMMLGSKWNCECSIMKKNELKERGDERLGR